MKIQSDFVKKPLIDKGQEKPVIIMQPGPIHLFWTTGCFYFWELKNSFNFVFLVPDNYRQSIDFQKLVSLSSVLHVEYESNKEGLSLHRNYFKKYSELLLIYRPSHIFMYNQAFIDNMYLNYLSKKICKTADIFCFQLGRLSNDWRTDHANAKSEAIGRMAKRYFIFAKLPLFAEITLMIKKRGEYLFNYKLAPYITAGFCFSPPLNIYNGEVDISTMISYTSAKMNTQLTYSEREFKGFHKLGIRNLKLIKHPLANVGESFFKFMHGEIKMEEAILVLPSYGFTSKLLQEGWSQAEVVEHVSSCWIEALRALLLRFPGHGLKMKLHPVSQQDENWRAILKKITTEFNELEVIDSVESAEWWIVKSRVIVGDVTSALWWAAMYGEKIVLSLDIFGYQGGGDMKQDAGIQYCASVGDIEYVCDLNIAEKYQIPQTLSDIVKGGEHEMSNLQ